MVYAFVPILLLIIFNGIIIFKIRQRKVQPFSISVKSSQPGQTNGSSDTASSNVQHAPPDGAAEETDHQHRMNIQMSVGIGQNQNGDNEQSHTHSSMTKSKSGNMQKVSLI